MPSNSEPKKYGFFQRNFIFSALMTGIIGFALAKILFSSALFPFANSDLHILYLDKNDVTQLVNTSLTTGAPLKKVIFKFFAEQNGNISLQYFRGASDYMHSEPSGLPLQLGAIYPGSGSIPARNISFSDQELRNLDDGNRDNIQKLRDFLGNTHFSYITFSPAIQNLNGTSYIIYTLGLTNTDPKNITSTSQINTAALNNTKLKPVPPYTNN